MALNVNSAQVANRMKLVVSCKATIKPSSPTPHHLRNLKMSLVDLYVGAVLNPRMLLFYSAEGDVRRFDDTNMSYRLKQSLSGVLTEFYPLAGRFSDDRQSINCSDSGVEYTEVRVGAPFVLGQLLSCPDSEELEQLYPPDTTGAGVLCTVQVTIFEGCGGMVIGVCVSHAVGDSSALANFINSWAAMARGGKIVPSPKFGFADIFPPRDLFALMCEGFTDAAPPPAPVHNVLKIPKTFVFSKSEIAALRAHCADLSPTRVQVVCGIIFKCLISVERWKSSKPIVLYMPINWARKTSPPLPPNYVGNFTTTSMSSEFTEPKSFHDLVRQVGEMTRKYNSEYLRELLANDAKLLHDNFQREMQLHMKSEAHFLGISSCCNYPFYEAEFGWGRPTWATMFLQNSENFVTLLETKDGEGIEARVTLDDKDMTRFEAEFELLLRDFGVAQVRHIVAKI